MLTSTGLQWYIGDNGRKYKNYCKKLGEIYAIEAYFFLKLNEMKLS